MSYNYDTEKTAIFTERGQVQFLAVRDKVKHLIKTAGAFREAELNVSGNGWLIMACLDRLVELGEIVVVRDDCWRQFRVYSTSQVTNT